MKIEWTAVIGGLMAGWFFVKKWTDELSKVLQPLCEEAEKLAIDGIIDKADRKILVKKSIKTLEINGKIKLNFFSKLIVSFLIDKVAEKLPDFKVSQETKELLKDNFKQKEAI